MNTSLADLLIIDLQRQPTNFVFSDVTYELRITLSFAQRIN